MDYKKQLEEYPPCNEQEAKDKKVILNYIRDYKDTVLTRENNIAHITSSGFILNPSLDRVLMVHHNILRTWAWTGGHADGDSDLLSVALKEAKEETGISDVAPLGEGLAAIDILNVTRHLKNGLYINSHLHLSFAYILICKEDQELKVCEGENTAVNWFSIKHITEENFSVSDTYLYQKLLKKARSQ